MVQLSLEADDCDWERTPLLKRMVISGTLQRSVLVAKPGFVVFKMKNRASQYTCIIYLHKPKSLRAAVVQRENGSSSK